MAIIPRVDESQVLSSSSPVAISGTNESRLMSNAGDQFGSALMKIGHHLSAIENEGTKEKGKYDTIIRTSRFSVDMATLDEEMKNSESYAQGSNYNEMTGTNGPNTPKKYMEQYQAAANKLMEKYLDSIEDSGGKRIEFQAEAEKIMAMGAQKFYASAVTDYAAATTRQLDETISVFGSEVFSNVGKRDSEQGLAQALEVAKVNIQTSSFLTQDEKDAKELKAAKSLYSEYFNGHLDKISRAGSSEARDMWAEKALSTLAAGSRKAQVKDRPGVTAEYLVSNMQPVFTSEEKDKIRDSVHLAVYQGNSRSLQRTSQLEAYEARNMKKTQESTTRNLVSEIVQKVVDGPTRELALFRIDQSLANQALTPQGAHTLKNLVNERAFAGQRMSKKVEEEDTAYREKYIDRVLKAENIEDVKSDPYNDMSSGVSLTEVTKLQAATDKISNALAKDPSIRSKMNMSVQSLNKVMQDPGIARLPRDSRLAIEGNIAEAKKKLYRQFMDQPSSDIPAMAEQLIKNEILPNVRVLKGVSLVVPRSRVEVKAAQEALYKEYMRKKNTSTLTKEDELSFKRQIKVLMEAQLEGGQ